MGRRRRSPRSVGLGVFTFWLAACAIFGQTTGSIIGRVVDPTGSPLPGVAVEATSERLQGARAATTSSSGAYRFASLPPGSYRVRATLSGFRSVEKAATVSLDATATVDLTLQVSAEEQVVVSGEAPLIDKTATTTGTNYTSNVIAHLPVSRNYADIVKSNPGVSTDRGDTEGRSLALTIYGATSAENQWIIDGVNTTNVLKGVQGKAINNEFVQEVEVKTGGYQAEYGRALGGVVNVITKSGGNEFHGDGFVYYDSTGTAAEQQFKPGDSGIAQMRVGGRRALRLRRRPRRVHPEGPSLVLRRVQPRQPSGPAVARAVVHVRPDGREASRSTPAENLYSGKLTWNVASSTTVVGTVFADPSSNSGAAGADPRQGLGVVDVTPPVSLDPSTWYSTRAQGGTDFGLRLTQLFGSRALVTLQGSYHKDQNALTAPEGIRYIDETCAGGTPDNPCDFPSGAQLHHRRLRLRRRPRGPQRLVRASRYAANVTLYEGNHEIKVGGDYMDGRTDATCFWTGEQVVSLRNEYGQPYYMHRFFAVSPDDPTLVPNCNPGAQVLDYGVYLQDSWRVAPGLTVNVGLRWDGEQTNNYLGQTVLRFNNEWQPRVGVVWDPWRDGATKIYAFAGRFSYALPTVAAASLLRQLSRLRSTYNFDPVSVVQDPNVLNHEEPTSEAARRVRGPGGRRREGVISWTS